MAQIPKEAFSQSINQNVGGFAKRNTSDVGQGLSELGQGLAKFGIGLQDLEEKRARAKSDNFVNNMQNELIVDSAESNLQDTSFYEGSSYEGYAKNRQEFRKGRRDFYMENAPDQASKERVRLHFDRKDATEGIRDDAFEKSKAVDFFGKNYTNNLVRSTNVFRNSPDLDTASQYYDDQLGHLYNEELLSDKQKISKVHELKSVTTSTLDGFLFNKGAGLMKGKAFLEGKTGHKNLMASIDEKTRQTYITRFEKAIEGEKLKVKGEFISSAEDIIASVESGVVTDSKLLALNSLIPKIDNLNSTTKSKALIDLKSKVVLAQAGAEFKQNLEGVPVGELEQIHSKLKVSDVSSKTGAGVKKLKENIIQEKIDLWKKDAVTAALQEDSRLQEGTKQMMDYIESRGGKPRLYTEASEKRLISQLETSPDKVSELADLEKVFKENNSVDINRQWMNEVSKKNPEMAKFARALETNDPLTRLYLLRSKAELGKQKLDFGANHPDISTEDIVKSLRGDKLINDLLGTIGAEGDEGSVGAMTQAMAGMVKDKMNYMQNGLSSVPKETIKEVAKRFVDDNYHMVEGNGYKVALPKSVFPTGVEKFEDFMDDYSDLEDLDEEDMTRLGIDHTIIKDSKGSNFYKNGEEFMKSIAEQGGRFQLTDDNENLVITFRDPVLGRLRAVSKLDNNGKRVLLKFPIKDITSNTNPYSK